MLRELPNEILPPAFLSSRVMMTRLAGAASHLPAAAADPGAAARSVAHVRASGRLVRHRVRAA